MSAAKTLCGVSTRAGSVSNDPENRHGGVEVFGFAQWLKGEPMVSAVLSPRQARRLAIELLKAAEQIEQRASRR